MGNSGSKTNILIGRFSLSFTGSSLERKRFSFPERFSFYRFDRGQRRSQYENSMTIYAYELHKPTSSTSRPLFVFV